MVVDLMAERGMAGAFEKISNTAELGAYVTGPRVVGEEARRAMAATLEDVRDGAFVRRLMADYDAGFPELLEGRRQARAHPIEAAGKQLKAVAEAARDSD
jgi:ketol-acid reductoisomerase